MNASVLEFGRSEAVFLLKVKSSLPVIYQILESDALVDYHQACEPRV